MHHTTGLHIIFITVLAASLTLAACGEITVSNPDAGDAPIDAATDAATDAASLCADQDCDDGMFCNGVETCDPSEGCVSGQAPDCGVSDICVARSCDESADQCAEEVLIHVVEYQVQFGSSGSNDLGCNESFTAHTDVGFCDNTIDMIYSCQFDGEGRLRASSYPSEFTATCLGTAGDWVTSGCSTAPTAGNIKQVQCCFP